MSRSDRRKKEKKLGLKVWVPIISVIVVGVTIFMLHDLNSKVDKMKEQNVLNIASNQIVENTVSENVVNNTVENTSVEEKNEVTNTSKTNTVKNTTTNSNKQVTTPGITDKKQKAIELVEDEWGKDDTVDFVFDYVNENGEYVIAVKDRNTATVKCYYRVNLDTQTVELD